MKTIAGDYAVVDLTPKSTNIGGRLVKHLRMAGSGCYKYHRSEAATFGLDASFLPGDQQFWYAYRPAEVLRKNASMFARIPIITGGHVKVVPENA